MHEVLTQVAVRQHDTIWLGVWEKNQRAISSYSLSPAPYPLSPTLACLVGNSVER
jgi:hypothetical protein